MNIDPAIKYPPGSVGSAAALRSEPSALLGCQAYDETRVKFDERTSNNFVETWKRKTRLKSVSQNTPKPINVSGIDCMSADVKMGRDVALNGGRGKLTKDPPRTDRTNVELNGNTVDIDWLNSTGGAEK